MCACLPVAFNHATFPTSILIQNHLIFHPEALNAAVALKVWAPLFSHQLVHLFSDNALAVSIFQAGQDRNAFLQHCARDIWLTCAKWDISLVIWHIPGEQLKDTADALSYCHLSAAYKERVSKLVADREITMYQVPDSVFNLSNDI